MRVSTLVCDWCRAPRDAVASVRLTISGHGDGRQSDPKADLCGAHLKALTENVFGKRWRTKAGLITREVRPEHAVENVERHREGDIERHKQAKRKKGTAKQRGGVGRTRQWRAKGLAALDKKRTARAARIAEREQAILAALRKADHRLARPELDKATGITVSKLKPALAALVERGEVTRYSSGPHARYELASKARHGSNSDAA
jgi:hypothetical protein